MLVGIAPSDALTNRDGALPEIRNVKRVEPTRSVFKLAEGLGAGELRAGRGVSVATVRRRV